MDKPKFETDNGKFVELARFKTEAGLTAVIRYAINRNQDSYYCGYVQVPKGSVLDGLQWHEDPNDILESIWDNTQGGDTWIDWSGELSSILDHNTENLGWAFGFDTNHPSFSTSKLACQLSELQEEMIHATYDYIKQQCELLAKKLHKIISEAPPVEPERVSVQEFAKDPVGKWYSFNGTYYYEATVVEPVAKYKRFEDVLRTGHLIYFTNPSAWLAWKAEQEGKSV